eukprot:c17887_g1_i5.p1 GENE.c17887_g1_i5~~c17887_g1_i5.p1  ORF type:complete len:301 (+),score=93.68 c17887_g1_i5:37-939(+)
MFLVRIVLGSGEAFLNPACYSMIADLVSDQHRTKANALYSWSVYFGYGFASLSILMATSFGWRNVCIAFNLIATIPLLLLIFIVKDNSRTHQQKVKLPLMASLQSILQSKPFILLLIASSVRFFSGFALAEYLPIFFKRTYPTNQETFASINFSIVVFCGVASTTLSGYFCDKYGRKYQGIYGYFPAGMLILAIPCMFLLFKSGSFYLSALGLGVGYFLSETWIPPIVATIQHQLPAQTQGVAFSLYSATSLIGNFGPAVIGWFDKGDSTLGDHLLFLMSICYFVSAIFFALMGKSILIK